MNSVRHGNALSQEEYIKRVTELYSDRYTFEKAVYRGGGKKLTVTCKKHGDLEVIASAFLNYEYSYGCLKCRQEKRPLKKPEKKPVPKEHQTPLERFIKYAGKNNEYRYDYSKTVYTGTEKFVDVICKAHGLFRVRTAQHQRGIDPCPICKRNRKQKGKQIAEEEYRRLCGINESR